MLSLQRLQVEVLSSAAAEELALRDALLDGERAATARFVSEYGAAMLATLRARLSRAGRRDEAEDVLQSLFIELFRDRGAVLRSWDPRGGRSLKNYLRVLAGFRASSLLRGRRTEALDDKLLAQLGAVPHHALLSPEGRVHLDVVVRRLLAERPAERAFFERAFLEEDSTAELAAAFAQSEQAIYQRRHRLRVRLRELLDEVEA